MTSPQYGQRPVNLPPSNPGGPGGGNPARPIYGTAPVPFLVVIGDIGVTSDYVATPSGTFPLAEVSIYAMDQTHVLRKTPTWAIVLAILGALFFLVGLLFLLVKEETVEGYVSVTVDGQGWRHVSMVPISSRMAITDVMQRVAYAQSLSAIARSR